MLLNKGSFIFELQFIPAGLSQSNVNDDFFMCLKSKKREEYRSYLFICSTYTMINADQPILVINGSSDLYGSNRVLLDVLKLFNTRIILLVPVTGPLCNLILEDSQYKHVSIVVYKNIPLAIRGKISPFKMIRQLVLFFFYVRKAVRLHNLKLAYVNTLSCLPALYVLKSIRVPRIVHIHEMLENERLLTRMMNKYALKWSDWVICVSNAVKQNLLAKNISYDRDKITVVRNGVKSFYSTSERTSPRIVISYFGRIKPEKGVWFFLDAIEALPEELKVSCSFKIYGSTPPGKSYYYSKLLQDVESHKFKEAISVEPFVSDITQFLNESDIIVVPSLANDSFPTIILEALSAGKPIIATNTGGAVESVLNNQNGFIIEPNDIRDFSAKLSELICNNELRNKMGISGRQRYLNEFKLEDFTDRLTRNIESFITTMR